jgi:NAD+ synthase
MSPLKLDPAAATTAIATALQRQVREVLHRRGLVVGMSGGIDSSVCAGLAVRALGPQRVFGLFMPEQDSDPASLELARAYADQLGIDHTTEVITPILAGAGCYRRRNEAIRRLVPEFRDDWKCKIGLPGSADSDRLSVFSLVYQAPGGEVQSVRLGPAEYRQIVAATNFKQRIRAMLEYYHADRLHYAVVGTPNRLEYDQGFFVKGGDGLADVKPIAHLYKDQVYQLAEHLEVPAAIRTRPSTTDTYTLPQSQEEFYFRLPLLQMDLALYAFDTGVDPASPPPWWPLSAEALERAYRDIRQKRSTTRYLHLPPLLVEHVPGVGEDAD